MDSLSLWIYFFVFLGGALSVSVAALYLTLPEAMRSKTIDYLVSLAIGILLGTSFSHLIPEALAGDGANSQLLMATLLFSLLMFFILEKTLIWRHYHPATGEEHKFNGKMGASVPIILFGDSFHNFLDGVLIASAFMVDFSLGVVTGLAIVAHEIPQELGDFAILIKAGLTRRRAFLFNLFSSLVMLLGATVALSFETVIKEYHPYLLMVTAGAFIYVAMSDLIPALGYKADAKQLSLRILLVAVGMIVFSIHHH